MALKGKTYKFSDIKKAAKKAEKTSKKKSAPPKISRRLPASFPFKSILVTVTEEDIENGIRAENEDCPIAIACKRAVGLPCRVSVGVHHEFIPRDDCWCDRINNLITFNGVKSVLQFEMPNKVLKFVQDFDNEKKVKPFSFELKF